VLAYDCKKSEMSFPAFFRSGTVYNYFVILSCLFVCFSIVPVGSRRSVPGPVPGVPGWLGICGLPGYTGRGHHSGHLSY
jgi:hypothetical protein